MTRTFAALVGLALVAATTSLGAQAAPAGARPPGHPPAGNGEVRGMILDSKDSVPLARASVAVRSKKDASLVAGAIATANGTFRVQGLRPGGHRA